MGNFGRFHARLQEKADNPNKRAVLYVAFGDSVTQGCMEYGINEHEQIYHQILKKRVEQRYPTTVLNVINSGVSGDSAAHSRSRWDRDLMIYKPDLVTIKFGLNDAHGGEKGLEAFTAAINDLVERLRTETEADILLITPGMMMKRDNDRVLDEQRQYVHSFLKIAEAGYLQMYVDALRKLAADQAVPLLDIYAMWERMERVGVDIHTRLINGINHPDQQTHQDMADALENMLFNNS